MHQSSLGTIAQMTRLRNLTRLSRSVNFGFKCFLISQLLLVLWTWNFNELSLLQMTSFADLTKKGFWSIIYTPSTGPGWWRHLLLHFVKEFQWCKFELHNTPIILKYQKQKRNKHKKKQARRVYNESNFLKGWSYCFIYTVLERGWIHTMLMVRLNLFGWYFFQTHNFHIFIIQYHNAILKRPSIRYVHTCAY